MVSGGSVPAEYALLPCIDVGDDRHQEEEENAAEEEARIGATRFELREVDRPWVEEDDLDIEDKECHRQNVEANIESPACAADGVHARLVRTHLLLAHTAGAEQM